MSLFRSRLFPVHLGLDYTPPPARCQSRGEERPVQNQPLCRITPHPLCPTLPNGQFVNTSLYGLRTG